MTAQLKKSIGEAGALLDDSMGLSNLYDVLAGLVDQVASLTAQFNQLRLDHNSSTAPTSATAVSTYVTKE